MTAYHHATADARGILIDWLARLSTGSPLSSGPLTIVPVFGGDSKGRAHYRTLSQALALGDVQVMEQPQATVGGLRVINQGPLPVLILDGEEVVGGLQNRVVNTTVLIPAKSTLDLPVSCIEHGRCIKPTTTPLTVG